MLNPINCLNESFTRPIKALDSMISCKKSTDKPPPGPWAEMNINSLTDWRREGATVQWTSNRLTGAHTDLFSSKFHPTVSHVSGLKSNYAAYWVFIPPHGQSMAFNVSMKAWLRDVTLVTLSLYQGPHRSRHHCTLCCMIQKTKQKTFCQTMPV